MGIELPTQKVEVRFAGAPPVHQVERASGVSDVASHGHVLCCVVCGSFQPFLEALSGHEVLSLTTTQAVDVTGQALEGDR